MKEIGKIILTLSAFFFQFSYANPVSLECTYNGIPLYGRVKVVESFEDIRVKFVDSFEGI